MKRMLFFLLALSISACANTTPMTKETSAHEAEGPGTVEFDSTLDAHAGLRFDCAEDAHCVIKNVGNCCGYYPACVHVDTVTDPATVAAECAERDLAGICGYPVIEACACVAGRCRAVPGAGAGELK